MTSELEQDIPPGTRAERWAVVEKEQQGQQSSNQARKVESVCSTELDTVVREVKQELRNTFDKTGNQIKRLGFAIKKSGLVKDEDTCQWIKHVLKDEIKEDIISIRTIEVHCLDEWKRKTKPKELRQAKTKAKTSEQENAEPAFSEAKQEKICEKSQAPKAEISIYASGEQTQTTEAEAPKKPDQDQDLIPDAASKTTDTEVSDSVIIGRIPQPENQDADTTTKKPKPDSISREEYQESAHSSTSSNSDQEKMSIHALNLEKLKNITAGRLNHINQLQLKVEQQENELAKLRSMTMVQSSRDESSFSLVQDQHSQRGIPIIWDRFYEQLFVPNMENVWFNAKSVKDNVRIDIINHNNDGISIFVPIKPAEFDDESRLLVESSKYCVLCPGRDTQINELQQTIVELKSKTECSPAPAPAPQQAPMPMPVIIDDHEVQSLREQLIKANAKINELEQLAQSQVKVEQTTITIPSTECTSLHEGEMITSFEIGHDELVAAIEREKTKKTKNLSFTIRSASRIFECFFGHTSAKIKHEKTLDIGDF
jgi:hypothetical protein